MHKIAGINHAYKKAANRAPAKPRVRAGSSMPAAPVELAEPDALLEVCVPDDPDEPDVAVGFEPDEPVAPEEPDALEPPDEV